jgi:type IV pilus assembly protein PilB
MILATGPTGSGKTTTLYAILSRLISDEVNIVTVEDPPEYGIAGVNHVAVNPKTGMTFANILRAVLRQDPDIIMLGEIRDSETARVAVQAAMTGHLVLSTLHTNNAASAPVRLIDMGVEPYLVASSLLAVVAQRLVRKVCPQCKQKLPVEKGSPTHTFLGNVSHAITAPGCYHCSYTGYSGRTAIAEILPISPSIRDLIRKNSPSGEIQKCAVNEGMEPLVKKAQGKVKECLITAEEAIKNVFSGWEEEA